MTWQAGRFGKGIGALGVLSCLGKLLSLPKVVADAAGTFSVVVVREVSCAGGSVTLKSGGLPAAAAFSSLVRS